VIAIVFCVLNHDIMVSHILVSESVALLPSSSADVVVPCPRPECIFLWIGRND